jgi:hypothetical protein
MSRHFMKEANRLKEPSKPTWASFMIQTRQELGSYTTLVKQVIDELFPNTERARKLRAI